MSGELCRLWYYNDHRMVGSMIGIKFLRNYLSVLLYYYYSYCCTVVVGTGWHHAHLENHIPAERKLEG